MTLIVFIPEEKILGEFRLLYHIGYKGIIKIMGEKLKFYKNQGDARRVKIS
jgi:hypothetical protein